MAFRFNKALALKPIKVSWKLNPNTLSILDEMALEQGVKTEQLVQQMLEHVLGGRTRSRAGGAGAAKEQE